MKTNYSKKIDAQTIGILCAVFVAALVFWNSVYVYPVKIFVVVLHELSHGLAALLTGGRIDRIEVSPALGGVCWSIGGNRAIVLSAGYLGSMLWGGIILIVTSRTNYDNVLGAVLGFCLIIISLLYIRNLFGFLFTIGFGLLLIILSARFHNYITDLLMKFIGMASCLYAIIDIKADLIDRTVNGQGIYGGLKSDAFALAEHIGCPQLSVLIGIIWMIISVGVFFQVMRIAGKGSPGIGRDV